MSFLRLAFEVLKSVSLNLSFLETCHISFSSSLLPITFLSAPLLMLYVCICA